MAQNNKPASKSSKPQARDKKLPVYSSAKKQSTTLFASLDTLLEKNSGKLLILIFGICALFSFLLFQARMDVGGDDSGYILRAYDFIHKGAFPSFQGPLYPLVLSIFVSFAGIKIVFLKSLSIIFNLVALFFLYKAFEKRVPPLVLYSVLLLTAINSYILNFASLTYNEEFFMVLQYAFFYYFFKLQDSPRFTANTSLKDSWRVWLPVGLFIFLITFTRNIGISCLGGLMIYFAVRKQFRYIVYVLIAFLAFEIPVMLLEKLLLHDQNQWGSQGGMLLLKNPYDASEGKETLYGFVLRFFQNSNLYLSNRFFQILGFRSDSQLEPNPLLTLFFAVFLLFAIYRVVKSKNWYLLVAGLYFISMAGATFIVLQTRWDQPRMIMIYVPLLLMLFLYGLYDVIKKRSWALQMTVLVLVSIVFISEFSSTLKKAKENIPILTKNLHGDIYSGFTPDWVNYLRLSAWCENLPKDSLVACRKGPMSSIYANGRPFVNIARTDNIDLTHADSVIALFRRNHVRYILMAKLRIDPTNPDNGYINTMNRLIEPLVRQCPQKLKFIRQEGTSEEAQLYEINY